MFVRVAENELFSKEGHTRIIYSDYDKSNEDLVFIFDRLGYAEIYDFGGGDAYFNKFNSIFDFAGLVYYKKSQKNINHAAPFYCEFLDDNEQWEYQNTMLSPR